MWSVLRHHGINRDDLREVGKLGVARPVQRYRPHDESVPLVLEVATSQEGRLRILREVHGRRWAQQHSIPTAELFASHDEGAWMLSQWCESETFHDAVVARDYIDATLEVAERIGAAPPLRSGPAPQVWQSARHTVLLRTLRGVLGGLPLRAWAAARQAARQLPCVSVAHGDFYHRNLPRAANGGVVVVDWEYLGEHPRYMDELRFWSVLPTCELREYTMEKILERVPSPQHGHVHTLARWLALRRLGENLKAPRRHRNAADTAHAREVVQEVTA